MSFRASKRRSSDDYHHVLKRSKLNTPNIPQIQEKVCPGSPVHTELSTLRKYLAILDKKQVVDIILQLATLPELKPVLAMAIPRPTVDAVSLHFQSLQKKLFAAFPYTRGGPSYSDYSFNRVMPFLLDYHECVLDFIHYFSHPSHLLEDLNHIIVLFRFLSIACCSVARLPDWDSKQNNHVKQDLMSKLRTEWGSAVGFLGRSLFNSNYKISKETSEKLSESLFCANRDFHSSLDHIVVEFSQILEGFWRSFNTIQTCGGSVLPSQQITFPCGSVLP